MMTTKAAKRRKARRKAMERAGVTDRTIRQIRSASAKAKRDVSLAEPPERWDMGAMGPANRHGLTKEPVMYTNDQGEQVNPNNVKRMRRMDMLEVYEKRGVITSRQRQAGMKLRNAWEATEKAPGTDYARPIVDSTPKPDAAIDIQIDRMSAYIWMARRIPQADKEILHYVACEGRAVSHMRRYQGSGHDKGKVHLAEALERLADKLGV